MDTQPRVDGDFPAGQVTALTWKATLVICMAFVLVAGLPGCGGCLNQDPVAQREEAQKKKKKKKPKPDFEIGRLRATPRDETSSINQIKPGHWLAASQPMRANNYDFKADIESAAASRTGTPIDIENTPYRMTMSRPAALPKGQLMQFETMFFVPNLPETAGAGFQGSRSVWLKNSLSARLGGRQVKSESEPTVLMPDYQYFFVVLSNNPDDYGYLKRTDTINPPVRQPDFTQETLLHYRVILPQIKGRVPLPSQPLVWTSIAYVLWDGLNPDALSLDQQRAMLDWLHWGGQFIISGPNSLASLRGSFLDPYLPAYGDRAISLPRAKFASLQKTWAVPHHRTRVADPLPILPDKPLVGIELIPHVDAQWLPSCEDLILERRIGSGRIVATAFSPADRSVINWISYDSLLNSCLLRRPHRTFGRSKDDGSLIVDWARDHNAGRQLDARFTTALRFASRDLDASPDLDASRDLDASPDTPPSVWAGCSSQSSVAGWNNYSGMASRARQSLRDAAGISIPRAGFVFRVLVVYLLVLAPLNWAIFRILRRLEWAWVAAPLIAIAGAVVVVRLAQLDIGFARSRTEIGVLELQGGYDYGHLTRYTALYSSLSTGYELRFEEDSTLAMPFPHLDGTYRRDIHEPVKTVQLRRDQEITLSGFQVASNSTGMVHSEEMRNVGGSIQLTGDETTGWIVQNTTDLNLQDVGVFRKHNGGRIERAWIGTLDSAKSSPVSFQPAPGDIYFEQWTNSLICCSYERQQAEIFRRAVGNDDKLLTRQELADVPEILEQFDAIDTNRDGSIPEAELLSWCVRSRDGQLTLGRLFELTSLSSLMREGDIRLVGWTEQDLPGLEIQPAASQEETRLLVLAHLRHGELPKAQRDTNLKVDIERSMNSPWDTELP